MSGQVNLLLWVKSEEPWSLLQIWVKYIVLKNNAHRIIISLGKYD